MLNLERLIRKRLYFRDHDEYIGEIKDIVVDIDQNIVRSLLVDYGKHFHTSKYIDFNSIEEIGKDRIYIPNKNVLKDYRRDSGFLQIAKYNDIVEAEIFDKNDDLIGFLKDVYIEPKDGKILAYIVSNGFIDDITNGLMVVRNIDRFSYIKNRIKLDSVLENCSIDVKGGLKNLLEL